MREYAEERAKKRIALPSGRIDNCGKESGVSVSLIAGDEVHIRVSQRGSWEPSLDYPDIWRYMDIVIGVHVSLERLAGFIQALTTRYNWMVRDINQRAQSVPPLAPLDEIHKSGGSLKNDGSTVLQPLDDSPHIHAK